MSSDQQLSPSWLSHDAPKRKRVWAQDVAVSAFALRIRLETIRERGPSKNWSQATYEGVRVLLDDARAAAFKENPIPSRWGNWWRGTLIEAAYSNLHAAETEIVPLYDTEEVQAQIPEAVTRMEVGLNTSDPRRTVLGALTGLPKTSDKRAALRKVIEIGYAAADRQHARVRNFRNIIIVSAAVLTVFIALFVIVVSGHPSVVPLCFQPDRLKDFHVCPTGAGGLAGAGRPSGGDVMVIALLGLLGGAFAAAVSIRNLRGTSTPYDLPVVLALLKIPSGALTAIVAMIALHGDFVPGLSALDSQEQILAYALVFGYAQQLLTRLIDRQAQSVLNSVPSKDPSVTRPATVLPTHLDPEHHANPADGESTPPPEVPERSGQAVISEPGRPVGGLATEAPSTG